MATHASTDTPIAPEPQAGDEALARRTQQMLREHVPLTLLLDLADQAAPESQRFYQAEGGSAEWADR